MQNNKTNKNLLKEKRNSIHQFLALSFSDSFILTWFLDKLFNMVSISRDIDFKNVLIDLSVTKPKDKPAREKRPFNLFEAL